MVSKIGPGNPLVFSHIPKNAGTATINALYRMFGDDNVFYAGRPDRVETLRTMRPGDVRAYDCIGGHMILPMLRKVCGRGVYCTVLREPMARMISFYFHITRTKSHRQYELVHRVGMNGWLDWLTEDELRWKLHHQVYFVSGAMDADAAVSLLDDMIVGDQAALPEFIKAIANAAGAPVPELGRENSAPAPQSIDPRLVDRVRSIFDADFRFYEAWLQLGRSDSGLPPSRRRHIDQIEDASRKPDGNSMYDPCPVCASPFTAYVRKVPTIRTKREIALHTCLDCKSFWNPSGYREDERIRKLDVDWGVSVAERNRDAANRLFDKFDQNGIKSDRIAEIGCGIGTMLSVARARGKEAIGFDVNPTAIEYARETHKLDARAEFWSKDTQMPKMDLYLCISVLEHIEQPRALIESLCTAAKRDQASLFISVPFVDRDKWDFILDPDPAKQGTPFFDNDVHVVHYSTQGLMTAMREFGQENLELVRGWLWHGVLARPN